MVGSALSAACVRGGAVIHTEPGLQRSGEVATRWTSVAGLTNQVPGSSPRGAPVTARKRGNVLLGSRAKAQHVWGSAYSISLLVSADRKGSGRKIGMGHRNDQEAGWTRTLIAAKTPARLAGASCFCSQDKGTAVRRKELACQISRHQPASRSGMCSRLWVILRVLPNRNTQVFGSCRQTVHVTDPDVALGRC